ncbi:EB domain-containing protein [Polyangium mundeleinium]|uniref:EB domain-containing protein n=1 Tax=Polyangium mundeleinium TaxID=2995306 RepID=A0ABT5EQX9_9BACT|nr:EB domain-containing protein [Polyangium mundeleinium]MDC0744240.1 EB domain-containing protein [Polyangium mundeleinium]
MTNGMGMAALAVALVGAGCGARTELSESKRSEDVCASVGQACRTSAACCGGGSCNAGVCEAPLCKGGEAPVVLASEAERLSGVLADGDHVYFTHYGAGGAVLRVPKAGGAIETVVPASSWTESLVADADSLYYLDSDQVKRASKDGSGASLLAADQVGSMSIAVDASFVYWIDPVDQAVRRVSKAGGTPQTLVKDEDLTPDMVPRMIADDTTLYWSATGAWLIPGFHATPKEGGELLLLDGAPSTHFVADSMFLFWIDQEHYVGDATPARLVRSRKDGSEAKTLTDWTSDYPSDLAAGMAQDENYLYWANGQARIMNRIPKTGGEPVEIFSSPDPIHQFAVDTSCLYYVAVRVSHETGETTSSLLRAPRFLPGE